MLGVVSLLDQPHTDRVTQIWRELAQQFGVSGIFNTPYPHFSYHIARRYDEARIVERIQQIAAATVPFTVQTAGLGIFPGEKLVLYIAVGCDAALARLNDQLWSTLASCGEGIDTYYRPETWVPHITLAMGDITSHNLPDIEHFLAQQDFSWQIAIDNLAIIANTDNPQQIYRRFPLHTA